MTQHVGVEWRAVQELQRLRHGIAGDRAGRADARDAVALLHERIAPGKAKADATMLALRNAVPLRPGAAGGSSRGELRRVHVIAERAWSNLVHEETALTTRLDSLATEWQERTIAHRLSFNISRR